MRVQFGRWNLNGSPVDEAYLTQVGGCLSVYAMNQPNWHREDNIAILQQAYQTPKKSNDETEPCVLQSNQVICWDGRLDNREELVRVLGECPGTEFTDVEIVQRAYLRWGSEAFARFLGDWALIIWDRKDQSLSLARDFMGVRRLYYSVEAERITWCTTLDPFVVLHDKTLTLCEEYLAGWLGYFPRADLTPYADIRAVPPSSYVLVRRGNLTIKQYWNFDSSTHFQLAADSQYEEQFRRVFSTAVRRRLNAAKPILAELSGGMDSSSIVCMADRILNSTEPSGTPRLDTVSYFSAEEPDWNERPFFSKVEELRGRVGFHIDLGARDIFEFDLANCFEATPGFTAGRTAIQKEFTCFMRSSEYRVVLSGFGGDEVMGGVPTPSPELQDLLVDMRFLDVARALKTWALKKRQPWVQILLEAAADFLPPRLRGRRFKRELPWLDPDFVKRNWAALGGYQQRVHFKGARPSFQANMSAVDHLRRQLACTSVPSEPCYERRYPYLDRDLMEFVYSIPREQLLRPGQRRSLMRRALAGIVPAEILTRKRKAFVSRSPRLSIAARWDDLVKLSQGMSCNSLGILNETTFFRCLQDAKESREVPVVRLLRTICAELWLRNAQIRGLIFATE